MTTMGLDELPYDLILHVSCYLSLYDVLALQATCKSLRQHTLTRPVYRAQAQDLLNRARPLPLKGFNSFNTISTPALIQAVHKAQAFDAAWRVRAPRPATSEPTLDGKGVRPWYTIISSPPDEEIDWLSPITSSYTLCATRSGRVVCWDVARDIPLADWDPRTIRSAPGMPPEHGSGRERWELWKCRVEFEERAVYFTMARLLKVSWEDDRTMQFVLMKLCFPPEYAFTDQESGELHLPTAASQHNVPGPPISQSMSPTTVTSPRFTALPTPEAEPAKTVPVHPHDLPRPVFRALTAFHTAGVVMNVFLLDPPRRLLSAFVWFASTPPTIGLYVLPDWAKEEYVFIDTGIECDVSSNWSCILYDEQIVIHAEEANSAHQHFYPISLLTGFTRPRGASRVTMKPTSAVPMSAIDPEDPIDASAEAQTTAHAEPPSERTIEGDIFPIVCARVPPARSLKRNFTFPTPRPPSPSPSPPPPYRSVSEEGNTPAHPQIQPSSLSLSTLPSNDMLTPPPASVMNLVPPGSTLVPIGPDAADPHSGVVSLPGPAGTGITTQLTSAMLGRLQAAIRARVVAAGGPEGMGGEVLNEEVQLGQGLVASVRIWGVVEGPEGVPVVSVDVDVDVPGTVAMSVAGEGALQGGVDGESGSGGMANAASTSTSTSGVGPRTPPRVHSPIPVVPQTPTDVGMDTDDEAEEREVDGVTREDSMSEEEPELRDGKICHSTLMDEAGAFASTAGLSRKGKERADAVAGSSKGELEISDERPDPPRSSPVPPPHSGDSQASELSTPFAGPSIISGTLTPTSETPNSQLIVAESPYPPPSTLILHQMPTPGATADLFSHNPHHLNGNGDAAAPGQDLPPLQVNPYPFPPWYPESAHFVRQWWPTLPGVPRLSCTVVLLAAHNPENHRTRFVLAQHYFRVPLVPDLPDPLDVDERARRRRRKGKERAMDVGSGEMLVQGRVAGVNGAREDGLDGDEYGEEEEGDEDDDMLRLWYVSTPFEVVCVLDRVGEDGVGGDGDDGDDDDLRPRPLVAVDFGHAVWVEYAGEPGGLFGVDAARLADIPHFPEAVLPPPLPHPPIIPPLNHDGDEGVNHLDVADVHDDDVDDVDDDDEDGDGDDEDGDGDDGWPLDRIHDVRRQHVPKVLRFVTFPAVDAGGRGPAEVRTLATPAELDLDAVETINIDQSQGAVIVSVRDGKIFIMRYE
ncbi:hypothetical protein CONPUDRAFT_165959 [Coniophora puteana RWD-64-598 SS2]|uniref:F-box domain-containing protein n=1 Tax=Coniophora puteana (strain RWD-64-598) TaxID=741705 RepID=A0A5M3MNX8_CONPW|nr:uncharacterized protein CONPUDRAFT_165959 [Coniophora puteana RWD-64-598 SS2]EIW80435.1 hypothetical protein CONPUDRAFT_165959 [Coniophora puteana RWD-64-598 SS2]